jgi:peptidoglycan/xylan/chitin deacetylase (PgdA/CDA1 family)
MPGYRTRKFIHRQWANFHFSKTIRLSLNQPVVSFTFDDVPGVSFENGGKILSDAGFSGTFYVALNLLNASNPDDVFTKQQLRDAFGHEHELGCHTYGHIHLTQIPVDQAIQDMNRNRREMQVILPQAELKNFSYPYGEQTLSFKKYLGQNYRSARGVGHGINGSNTDLFNLKAIRLYEAQFPLGDIIKRLDEAERSNGWLIFYTHDVRQNPTRWGCSPGYFEAVVRETATRKLMVLPVNGVLDFIEESQEIVIQ